MWWYLLLGTGFSTARPPVGEFRSIVQMQLKVCECFKIKITPSIWWKVLPDNEALITAVRLLRSIATPETANENEYTIQGTYGSNCHA